MQFLPVYVLIGVLWLLLLLKVHPGVRNLRQMVGDAKAVLVMLPVVLFWPVEVFGILLWFFLVFVNMIRMMWREGRRHLEKYVDESEDDDRGENLLEGKEDDND